MIPAMVPHGGDVLAQLVFLSGRVAVERLLEIQVGGLAYLRRDERLDVLVSDSAQGARRRSRAVDQTNWDRDPAFVHTIQPTAGGSGSTNGDLDDPAGCPALAKRVSQLANPQRR